MCCRNPLQHTWSIALIVLATIGVAAQGKPDFSGRWVLATPPRSKTDIPLALSVRQTLVRTTVRGDPIEPSYRDITIERVFETAAQSENYLIGVEGGTVSGLPTDGIPKTSTTYHAVKWDGNALVFESGSYTAQRAETGMWAERREVWSLDTDARLRVVITSRSSGEAPIETTAVYRRP